jgi:hypothetical protein
LAPPTVSISFFYFLSSSALSTETPTTLVLRFFHSADSFATAPNSVVHTGVKSLGCENRIVQPPPIQLWRETLP